MKNLTQVTACKCVSCNTTIYSRARHDFHFCKCGEIAIDGGFDYLKLCYKNGRPQTFKMLVSASKKELYDDWNLGKDKFGFIEN